MAYQKLKIDGVPEPVRINVDGTKIIYKEKEVNIYLLKAPNHINGYKCCSIANKMQYVHRLVALTFVHNPNPVTDKIVIHKDGNSLNNHRDNLMWGNSKTTIQNRNARRLPGAHVFMKDKSYRGSSNISYEEALKAAQRLDNGETLSAIAKEYGVSDMSIVRIRKKYCKTKSKQYNYPMEVKLTTLKLLKKHKAKEVALITNIPYGTVRRWSRLYAN